MIKYFFQTLFQKLKLSFLISIIVIIITLPFNMSYLSIIEYVILCFIVVFCYSIIEGIYFYIKNKSYKVEYDYLRQLPRDYSPSMVSFLMNMKIEYKKDLLADLIYLEQQGVIKINDDEKIELLSNRMWNEYEKHLDYLVRVMKDMDNLNINDVINNTSIYASYKRLVIEDLKTCHLLDNYSVNVLNIIIIFVIFIALRIFMSAGMLSMFNFFQNNFIEGEISDMEALNLFVSFSNMAYNFQKMFSIFPAMIVIMIALIYLLPIIKRITGSDYMRSKQGKKDVSMWLSYYRFIKDFSIMDERELEEKNLWGYYFSYGLALGINIKVIKKFNLGYERYIIK